jgi:hypothetical protein
MNICRRPPVAKPSKAKPNPDYLARVRELPCCICEAFGEVQLSPTTAHHPIHGRYGNRKAPDEAAIPTCDGHHQGTFDTSKVALHREPSKWKRLYGADHEYIEVTQDKLGWTPEGAE